MSSAEIGDGFAGDANGASFSTETRAAAFRHSGVTTIATQENANVQLVFFPFEIGEETL